LRYGTVWNNNNNNLNLLRYLHPNGISNTDLTSQKRKLSLEYHINYDCAARQKIVGKTGVSKKTCVAYFVTLHYPVLKIESKVIVTAIFALYRVGN
jgi:hypothetical protein